MNRRILVSGAALVATAVLGGVVGAGIVTAVDDDPATASPAPAEEVEQPIAAASGAIADLYRRAAPSVVHVQVSSVEGAASGSGWVYDESHIVTNQHVVGGAETVTVRFPSGEEATARVVGADASTDVALLELERDLTPLDLGSSNALEVGDTVIAIGSPFGLEGTLTVGVVSGLHRELSAPDGFAIEGAIQTDAALNPGNSGGPLLDDQGRVVGMNSQIRSESGGSDGIGYAISIETIRSVVDQLLDDGTVEHPYLGVRVGDAEDGGAQLAEVVAGGPAEDAGLQSGDVVVSANGEELDAGDDLRRAVASLQPGDELELEVRRGAEELTVTVELGRRPSIQ
jgi:putative serine protease PepD